MYTHIHDTFYCALAYRMLFKMYYYLIAELIRKTNRYAIHQIMCNICMLHVCEQCIQSRRNSDATSRNNQTASSQNGIYIPQSVIKNVIQLFFWVIFRY